MIKIVLNEQQVELLAEGSDQIELLDPRGNVVGYVRPTTYFSDEDVVRARRAINSPGLRYSTAEVLDHLKSLDAR